MTLSEFQEKQKNRDIAIDRAIAEKEKQIKDLERKVIK